MWFKSLLMIVMLLLVSNIVYGIDGQTNTSVFLQSSLTNDETCGPGNSNGITRYCMNVTFTINSSQIALNITGGDETIDNATIQICENSNPLTIGACNCVPGTVVNMSHNGSTVIDNIDTNENVILETVDFNTDSTKQYWMRFGSNNPPGNVIGHCSFNGPGGEAFVFATTNAGDFGNLTWNITTGGSADYRLLWSIIGNVQPHTTFTILDEIGRVLITDNVTINSIGNTTVSTSTVSGKVTVVLKRNFEYRVEYSSPLFKKRDVFFTPVLLEESLDLYLLSLTNSTDVTITIQDNSGTALQGALIKLQKFFVSLNSYVVVAETTTDEQGETILDVDFDDAFYKIFAESGDKNTLTLGSKIFQTAITITLDILADPFEKIDIENAASTSLTFNNVTDTFTYSFNDLGGTQREVKLEVFERDLTGDILRCNVTQTISSGSLLCTVNQTNVTLFARGMIVGFNGESIITDTLSIIGGYIKTAKDLFGKTSLFYTVLFAGSVAGLGVANIAVAIIMFVLALGAMMIAGFSFINLGVYVMIVILGLLVVWRLKT